MTANEIILIVWNLILFVALVASIRANQKWVALNDQLMRDLRHPGLTHREPTP